MAQSRTSEAEGQETQGRPDIVAALQEVKRRRVRRWPQRVPRASTLGHPCERRLVYAIRDWEKAEPYPVTLQWAFDDGRMHEEALKAELREAGRIGAFEIQQEQRPFQIEEVIDGRKEVICAGHVDGMLVSLDGRGRWPFEVKSMSPYVYDAIDTVDDMRRHPRHYVRAYPDQLLLYLHGLNLPEGVFLLRRKATAGGAPVKALWMRHDPARVGWLLDRARRIVRHVRAGTYPERIDWDEDTCGSCAWRSLCLPDIKRDGLRLLDSDELLAEIEEWAALRDAAKRHAELWRSISRRLEGVESAIIGDWEVRGKRVRRKAYSVPEGEYWRVTLRPIASVDKERNQEL